MLCAVPVCAALIMFVNGASSPEAWWSDAAPEEDVTVDELLSAIKNILHPPSADANAHAVPPYDNARAKRWVRDAGGKTDFEFLRQKGLFGDIGQSTPPEDHIKHTNAQNVLFQPTLS